MSDSSFEIKRVSYICVAYTRTYSDMRNTVLINSRSVAIKLFVCLCVCVTNFLKIIYSVEDIRAGICSFLNVKKYIFWKIQAKLTIFYVILNFNLVKDYLAYNLHFFHFCGFGLFWHCYWLTVDKFGKNGRYAKTKLTIASTLLGIKMRYFWKSSRKTRCTGMRLYATLHDRHNGLKSQIICINYNLNWIIFW